MVLGAVPAPSGPSNWAQPKGRGSKSLVAGARLTTGLAPTSARLWARSSGEPHQFCPVEAARRDLPDICSDFEAELKAFNGEGDHVHLLVIYPPKVRKTGQQLKGVSGQHFKVELSLERPSLRRKGRLAIAQCDNTYGPHGRRLGC
jgi:Transposase IS200 like